MLEFIARVPYQAWERMGYLTLARYRGRSALARRVFERIVESRADQDNEQYAAAAAAGAWFEYVLLHRVDDVLGVGEHDAKRLQALGDESVARSRPAASAPTFSG